LDQLTKDFFAGEFPGFTEQITLADHVLANNVPVVEVDLNISFPTLFPIDDCKKLAIPANIRQIFAYELEPRIVGWGLEVLWSDGTVVPALKNIYNKQFFDAVPYKQVVPEARLVKDTLTNIGFDVRLCWISSFAPGGYERPHRDIALKTHPLTYFWIPLNHPAGADIKSYPYGSIKVNLGSMYLLNQENFIHAVYNNSNETRYALLGHFDQTISASLADKILQAIKAQYKTI
jgi:hypothetical protein